MELARGVGIDVPETLLVPVSEIEGIPEEITQIGGNAFTIKRFDRFSTGDRIHIEDLAQIFGVYPEEKYKKASYRNIAEIVWKETGEQGIVEFIRRFVFNGLIGNGDMHLKNWSFIYPNETAVALAPAYDFVSTIPYLPAETLALKFVDSREFSSLNLDQFMRFVTKVGLPEAIVVDTVQETVQKFSEVWKTVKDFPLDVEFRNMIANHLKTIPLWAY